MRLEAGGRSAHHFLQGPEVLFVAGDQNAATGGGERLARPQAEQPEITGQPDGCVVPAAAQRLRGIFDDHCPGGVGQ